jgi:hypothetical protein
VDTADTADMVDTVDTADTADMADVADTGKRSICSPTYARLSRSLRRLPTSGSRS